MKYKIKSGIVMTTVLVSASQTFDSQEITFGRIQHVGLAENLDVETFPTLIYYKANSKMVKR
jgi:thioredoxin-related protein